VHTIDLTDDELRLLRAALTSYLDDFGHDEADILRQVKGLLAPLPDSPLRPRPEAPSPVPGTGHGQGHGLGQV
jgi:hypothetical protein